MSVKKRPGCLLLALEVSPDWVVGGLAIPGGKETFINNLSEIGKIGAGFYYSRSEPVAYYLSPSRKVFKTLNQTPSTVAFARINSGYVLYTLSQGLLWWEPVSDWEWLFG